MFSYNSDKIICISDIDVEQAKMILKSLEGEFQLSHQFQTTPWDLRKMQEDISVLLELELAIKNAEEKIAIEESCKELRVEVLANEQG